MSYLYLIPLAFFVLILVRYIQPWAERHTIPYPTILIILGFIVSEIVTSLKLNLGVDWQDFSTIINMVILPLLIYEIAFRLSATDFFKELKAIIVLAVPYLFISVFLVAIVSYLVLDLANFPITAAIILGAILSINDPVSVGYYTKIKQLPSGLVAILKGEGLFSSLIVIVLLSISLQVLSFGKSIENIVFLEVYVLFIKLFSGGIFTGFVCGAIGWLILRKNEVKILNKSISLLVVCGTFLISEVLLEVSGILAVLIAGLMLNAQAQSKKVETKKSLECFWQFNSALAYTLLYLIFGYSVYLPLIADYWVAIAVTISALLFARFLIVTIGFGVVGKYSKNFYLPATEQALLFFGSIKGAVIIALLLSLPESLPYSITIQAIGYGVVLFSFLIQAPIIRLIMPSIEINPEEKNIE